jgi:hypothetical protein
MRLDELVKIVFFQYSFNFTFLARFSYRYYHFVQILSFNMIAINVFIFTIRTIVIYHWTRSNNHLKRLPLLGKHCRNKNTSPVSESGSGQQLPFVLTTSLHNQIPQRLQAIYWEIRRSLWPKYMPQDVQHRNTHFWRQRRPHGRILPPCDGQSATPMARQSPSWCITS